MLTTIRFTADELELLHSALQSLDDSLSSEEPDDTTKAVHTLLFRIDTIIRYREKKAKCNQSMELHH